MHASSHLLCYNVYFSIIEWDLFITEILCYDSKNDDLVMHSGDSALSSLQTLLSENAEVHF